MGLLLCMVKTRFLLVALRLRLCAWIRGTCGIGFDPRQRGLENLVLRLVEGAGDEVQRCERVILSAFGALLGVRGVAMGFGIFGVLADGLNMVLPALLHVHPARRDLARGRLSGPLEVVRVL